MLTATIVALKLALPRGGRLVGLRLLHLSRSDIEAITALAPATRTETTVRGMVNCLRKSGRSLRG